MPKKIVEPKPSPCESCIFSLPSPKIIKRNRKYYYWACGCENSENEGETKDKIETCEDYKSRQNPSDLEEWRDNVRWREYQRGLTKKKPYKNF